MKTKHKVISKSGGLTIPADIRREYSFGSGEAVDIIISDGRLVLSPHTPRCLFCENTDKVSRFMGRYVCRACVEKMAKE